MIFDKSRIFKDHNELRDNFFGKDFEKKMDATPWRKIMKSVLMESEVVSKGSFAPFGDNIQKSTHQFIRSKVEKNEMHFASTGAIMDITNRELKAINEETQESAKILKQTYNEVAATFDLLEPSLQIMIQKIRSNRMACVSELSAALSIMRDVRKFFIEKEYEQEMDRLERFVKLGERMRSLIDDGTMEAICEMSLKLALGEGRGNDSIKREGA